MRILVVDDARDMRLVLQHLLQKLGHDVDTSEDGEHAWHLLQENSYQVVISDWVMPRVDGLALCRLIREADFPHYIYIILLTGMSGKQNLISGIEAGADDFATKPADIEELAVRLRSAERILALESSLAQKHKSLEAANHTIQEDLKNAAETQLSVLPAPLKTEELDAAWLFRPAIFVGGDTFNYFSISPELFMFYSIDISGHGVSAAMISMSLHSSLIQMKDLFGGPITQDRAAEIPDVFASNLNKMIYNNQSEHYLTMIFGMIDFSEKSIHYTQAGHPHPFFYNKKEDKLETLKINGFPIGLFEQAEYETQHINFASGDKFILYSDGISENDSAVNGEILETENLRQHFEQVKSQPIENIIETVSEKWLTKLQLRQLPDDVSILVFQFN